MVVNLRRLQPLKGSRLPAGLILGVLLLGVILIADGARRAWQIRKDLLEAQAHASSVVALVSPRGDLTTAEWPNAAGFRAIIEEGRATVEAGSRAKRRMGWLRYVLPVARPIPVWGRQLAHVPEAVDMAADLSAGAFTAAQLTEPLFVGESNLITSARSLLVDRYSEIDGALGRLEGSLLRAERLRAVQWRGPFSPIASAADLVTAYRDELREGRIQLRMLHEGFDGLLGFGEASQYLILGQNDHEIRPTGGFIGTIGRVAVVEGRVEQSDYRSSYDFSQRGPSVFRPPYEFANFFGASEWHVRDANWWPDFPTSAREVLRVIYAESGITADHVVAVDTNMIRLLLQVLGPISVPEYEEALTAENWFSLVESELAEQSGAIGHTQARAAYLRPVMRALLDRAEHAQGSQLPNLLKALRTGGRGRHLQVYSRIPVIEQIADSLGISGRMPSAADWGGTIAVVDANLSYSKIQPAVRRDVTYTARDGGIVDLTISWHNDLPTFKGERYERLGRDGLVWNPLSQEYRKEPGTFGTFTRIYIPPEAEVLSASGFDSPSRLDVVGGIQIASGFVDVRPGDKRIVRIIYRPAEGKHAERVTFWKQGGQVNGDLTVYADFAPGRPIVFRGAFSEDIEVQLPSASVR